MHRLTRRIPPSVKRRFPVVRECDALSFEIAKEWVGAYWDAFCARLRRREAERWTFSTLAADGAPEPIALDAVFARGRFSEVLMQRPGLG